MAEPVTDGQGHELLCARRQRKHVHRVRAVTPNRHCQILSTVDGIRDWETLDGGREARLEQDVPRRDVMDVQIAVGICANDQASPRR